MSSKTNKKNKTSTAKAIEPKEPETIEVSAVEEIKPEPIVGRMVKIKPETTTFIGGKGISDSVRNSELYISRVNPNKTVTIAYSNSMTDIDCLFTDGLILLDEVRTYHDEETECPKVSIRIFGVPERIENIRENQKRLRISDEFIFIDENHEGCVPTAKKAWSYPTDKEFVLVLQDDVELCDNFMHYVNRIVEAQPDSIISLFSFQFARHTAVTRAPRVSPYVSTNLLTAQGIIMRTEWIEECLASWSDSVRGDDVNIANWANDNNIRILTTIPVIVQHVGDKSVFEPARVLGRSEFYNKKPTEVDWDNQYVISGI